LSDKYSELLEQAYQARKFAYTPYSKFSVGAALLTKEGKIFKGCNIENASFTPTICAERTAIAKAVSEGFTEFEAIAVVGDFQEAEKPLTKTTPCGVCRQTLREFVNPKTFKIILPEETLTLEDLLPDSFGPDNLR